MARQHYRLSDLRELLNQRGQLPNARDRREQRRQDQRRNSPAPGPGGAQDGADHGAVGQLT